MEMEEGGSPTPDRDAGPTSPYTSTRPATHSPLTSTHPPGPTKTWIPLTLLLPGGGTPSSGCVGTSVSGSSSTDTDFTASRACAENARPGGSVGEHPTKRPDCCRPQPYDGVGGGYGPVPAPRAGPRLPPSPYLGLGLLHAVLRRQQFLIDLLQARSTDLSHRKVPAGADPAPALAPPTPCCDPTHCPNRTLTADSTPAPPPLALIPPIPLYGPTRHKPRRVT